MQFEDMEVELNQLKGQSSQLDRDIEGFVERFRKEFNSMAILNALTYLSQFIEYKMNWFDEKPHRKQREAAVVMEAERVSNINIESLFEREKDLSPVRKSLRQKERDLSPSRMSMMRRLPTYKTFVDEDGDSLAGADDQSINTNNASPSRRGTTTFRLRQLSRSKAGPTVFPNKNTDVQERIAKFFRDYPQGPHAVVAKVAQAYDFVSSMDKVLQSKLNNYVMSFKVKSEQYNHLQKLLAEQKSILRNYADHRRSVLTLGRKFDQSFVENFEEIISETNISQETNLININPALIKLNVEESLPLVGLAGFGTNSASFAADKESSVGVSTYGGSIVTPEMSVMGRRPGSR